MSVGHSTTLGRPTPLALEVGGVPQPSRGGGDSGWGSGDTLREVLEGCLLVTTPPRVAGVCPGRVQSSSRPAGEGWLDLSLKEATNGYLSTCLFTREFRKTIIDLNLMPIVYGKWGSIFFWTGAEQHNNISNTSKNTNMGFKVAIFVRFAKTALLDFGLKDPFTLQGGFPLPMKKIGMRFRFKYS